MVVTVHRELLAPDGGWGWMIVIAYALCNVSACAVVFCCAVAVAVICYRVRWSQFKCSLLFVFCRYTICVFWSNTRIRRDTHRTQWTTRQLCPLCAVATCIDFHLIKVKIVRENNISKIKCDLIPKYGVRIFVAMANCYAHNTPSEVRSHEFQFRHNCVTTC